jgi:hypothetical protein
MIRVWQGRAGPSRPGRQRRARRSRTDVMCRFSRARSCGSDSGPPTCRPRAAASARHGAGTEPSAVESGTDRQRHHPGKPHLPVCHAPSGSGHTPPATQRACGRRPETLRPTNRRGVPKRAQRGPWGGGGSRSRRRVPTQWVGGAAYRGCRTGRRGGADEPGRRRCPFPCRGRCAAAAPAPAPSSPPTPAPPRTRTPPPRIGHAVIGRGSALPALGRLSRARVKAAIG